MKINKNNQLVISKEELNVVPVVRLIHYFNNHWDWNTDYISCPLGVKKDLVIEAIIKYMPYEEYVLCKGSCRCKTNQILIDEYLYDKLVLKTKNLPVRIMLKNAVIEKYRDGSKIYNKNGNLIWRTGECKDFLRKEEHKTLQIEKDLIRIGKGGICGCIHEIEDWEKFVKIAKERNV